MEIERKKRKEIIDTKAIKLQKLKIKFDITTLNMIIAFIYKDSVLRTRKTLTNIYRLFESIDEHVYDDNPSLKERVWVIKQSLYARLIKGFDSNNEYVKQYCLDDIDCSDYAKDIIESIDEMKISHEESKYLIRKIDDTLEFGYTIAIKDVIKQIINQIEDGDFKSYKMVQDDLYDIATAIINIKRNTVSLGADQTFSLQADQFDIVIDDAMQKLKDRIRIFITGMQRLNTILSPGYMSKRLYTYLAFPGKGKSTILLKSALDIRKYNK